MNYKIKVRALIFLDGRLFAARLKLRDGSVQNFWSLIGGHVDPGEKLDEALHREIIEETAIKPEVGNLAYVHQFKNDSAEYIEFFFHINNPQDFTHVDLSKTTHGSQEIAEIGFIDLKTEKVLPEFLKEVDLNPSEVPTKLYSYM